MLTTQRFEGRPQSVRAAREFTRETLEHELGMGPSCALLVASELATNAVLHAGGDFEVRLDVAAPQVVVAVVDGSPVMPGEGRPRPEGGRGLQIVDALSVAWGAEAQGHGKCVWARLDVSPSSVIFEGHSA